ncbi:MAG TPA: hypothetical protein VFA67_07885 [Candidatus Sulfotelmatobacter sp.]|nr:hypothetical protein [Candidatus Sulfotelmatobacter sp.]
MKLIPFSPHASTRAIHSRITAPSETWSSTALRAGDIGFLHSWFEPDLDFGDKPSAGVNWGAISGLALCFAVSGGFWAGLVLLLQHIWK